MGLGMGIGCEDFGVSAAHAANRNGMAKAIKRTVFLLISSHVASRQSLPHDYTDAFRVRVGNPGVRESAFTEQRL
jgi:hypothetical protein